MESQLKDLPVAKKLTFANEKPEALSSCCAPKNDAQACCTPSQTETDNDGACCAQPADGSACCDK